MPKRTNSAASGVGARLIELRGLAQIEKLEPTEKRQVLQLIDAFIERGVLKRKVQGKAAA